MTSPVTPSSFKPETLRNFLWHDNIETREKALKLFTSSDLWLPKYNIPLAEQRELAYQRLQALSKAKLFSVKDFLTNPRNIFTGTAFLSVLTVAHCVSWPLSRQLLFSLLLTSIIVMSTPVRHPPTLVGS